MTLSESIARHSAVLPPEKQREVLRFVKALQRVRRGPARRAVQGVRGVHPALKPVVGIWAGRSDLPGDAVEAVKTLRQRSAERRRNG
jgi:hypothetical protein